MVQRWARGSVRLSVLLFSALALVSSATAIRSQTSPRRNLLSTCNRLVRVADGGNPAAGELCHEPYTAPFYNHPTVAIVADTQRSGLQDATPVVHDDPYTAIKPVRRGTFLTGADLFTGAQAGRSLAGNYTRRVTYTASDFGNGDSSSDICETIVAGFNGTRDAISINDAKLIQYNAIWLLDPANYMAVKVSTINAPLSSQTIGKYYTRASDNHGRPTQIAVDSNGNAWVGHSTNATDQGSVVLISGTSGCENSAPSAFGSDNCVSKPQLVDLGFDITAMAIDGADNLWILAVKESKVDPTSSILNVYKATSDGLTITITLMYDSITLGTDATPSSGVAPGGSYAVVDKYGYLYTGSNVLKYNGLYNVLRMNTVNITNILVMTVGHEANVLNLDTNSDLWVAGGAGVTKITTLPNTIARTSTASTGTFTTATTGVNVILATFTSTAVNHNAIQTALTAACPSGNDCCLNGTLNGGIAITRNLTSCNAGPTTDTIYVANTCNFGLVLPLTGMTPGAAITTNVPSAIQSVGVDSTSGVWLTGYSLSGNPLDVVTTMASRIPYVPATVATSATLLASADFVGATIYIGAGDTTGYITAQPPTTAQYTYVHDTGIASAHILHHLRSSTTSDDPQNGTTTHSADYYKWNLAASDQNGARLRWVSGDSAQLQVSVGSSNDSMSYSNTAVLDSGSMFQSPVPNGRYFQVIFTLPRYPKTIAYPGPQGYGISPRFSEISIVVPNQFPNAICRSIRARATANAGGKCANPLSAADSSINAGSYDPDFAEYDSASLQYDLNAAKFSNLTSDNVNIDPSLFVPMSDPTAYPVTTLVVQDFQQNIINKCTAKVEIWDENPPVLTSNAGDMTNLANNMDTVSGSSLCTWPANYEYYCLRDVFNNVGGSFVQTALLPVTDNCAAITDGGAGGALTVDPVRAMLGDASYPIPVYGSSGFSCVDTDQRSEVGDCTLTSFGTGANKVYNLCVKAQRRTVYTNTDRVFTMRFNVQDMGTRQGLNDGTIFVRTLRIPPIWKFFPAATCPRANYVDVAASNL